MFDQLEKYKTNDHFILLPTDSLDDVCNAPDSQSGVYLIYALNKGNVELLYIGASGKVTQEGTIKTGKGGLYESIVNGIPSEKKKKASWIWKMKKEKIEALDVYWYVTLDDTAAHIPAYVEAVLMQQFYEMTWNLPRWNAEF